MNIVICSMRLDHYSMDYMAKPVIKQWWIHLMEFMYWRRIGSSDHHDCERYVCETTHVTFILTSVNSSKSATMFSPQTVRTENHLVLLTDLRESL